MDQQNNPSVPGSEPESGHPKPVIRPLDDSGQAGPGQPGPGWGAPQPGTGQPGTGQPAAGWGAPQPPANPQPGQPAVGQPGPGWGAPQQYNSGQPRASFFKNWSLKKGLIVGGVAVVVAAAAEAGAYAAGNGTVAADTSSAQGPGAGQNGQGGFGGPGGANAGPGGLGVGMGGLNAAIHSEYVVLQNGSYVSMAGQLGTVTDVSTSSMTVKSDDGFTRTYALGTAVAVTEGVRQRGSGSTGTTLTLADVKSGSTVRVSALKESDKYTAQSIQIVTATTSSTQGTGTNN